MYGTNSRDTLISRGERKKDDRQDDLILLGGGSTSTHHDSGNAAREVPERYKKKQQLRKKDHGIPSLIKKNTQQASFPTREVALIRGGKTRRSAEKKGGGPVLGEEGENSSCRI